MQGVLEDTSDRKRFKLLERLFDRIVRLVTVADDRDDSVFLYEKRTLPACFLRALGDAHQQVC